MSERPAAGLTLLSDRRDTGSFNRVQQLGASPSRMYDLSYAEALVALAERLNRCIDGDSVLTAIPAEAAALIQADATAVLSRGRDGWVMLSSQSSLLPPEVNRPGTWADAAPLAGEYGAGSVADLSLDPRWTGRDQVGSQQPSWRSLLVADLESPRSRALQRIVWYAAVPDAFHDQAGVANLFARQAGLALHLADERAHLRLAVEARARISRAVGVLMSRYQLDEARAFSLLRRHSQQGNVKLRVVAEQVLLTGALVAATGG